MSELPDMGQGDAGIIAYYNPVAQSSLPQDDFDEAEALNYSKLSGATIYDNGFESTINPEYAGEVYCRVKSDGWHIVYTTPEAEDEPGWLNGSGDWVPDNPKMGGFDTIYHWRHASSYSSTPHNELTYQLEQLLRESSYWSTIDSDYSPSDIGMYSLDYQSASAVSMFRTFIDNQSASPYPISLTFSTGVKIRYLAGASAHDVNYASEGEKHYTELGGNLLKGKSEKPEGEVVETARVMTDLFNEEPDGTINGEMGVRNYSRHEASSGFVVVWE